MDMSRLLEQIILKSPYLVRTIGANIKSWQLNRLRRGGNWENYLQQNRFERYFEQPWDELQIGQSLILESFLAKVRTQIPFYREYSAQFPTVRSVDDLRAFPTLSKEQVRAAGQRLFNPILIQQQHYTGHTSGTTGTPLIGKLTLDALRNRFAMRDNFYKLHGCDPSERSLRMGGRLFMSVTKNKPPFWIRDYATNQLMFSLYHMSDIALNSFLQPLAKYSPVFVTGYPSAIYTLARFCRQHGFEYRPRAVFTDSETVLDYQRKEIESAWQCSIYDYYGMEVGWVAGQCERGRYHISPLTSVVEILDDTGKVLPPGELGEIVVTDLTNPLMPLIRYRTGDAGIWSVSACNCGWNTPALDYIEGRIDDVVLLPNGRKIGRLDHIFKTVKDIRECQIIQEAPNRFVFLVAPETSYNIATNDALMQEAHARLGHDVIIEIQLVEAVPRSKAGKFRSVISRVNTHP